MRIDVLSIFPDYLAPLDLSLVGKARARGLLDIAVHDLRAYATDTHHSVDDAPYGGGAGMVMSCAPWFAALRHLLSEPPAVGGAPAGPAGDAAAGPAPAARVVVPTPSGRPLTQALAAELAGAPWLVVCCGRYEGIDQRVLDAFATDEISLGDYVVNGGEVAALVLIEAVARLLPGVVGNAASVTDDSFATGLLEGPVYTRPEVFEGRAVPPVLLSGDHAAIAAWRREQSLARTRARRPDLVPDRHPAPGSDRQPAPGSDRHPDPGSDRGPAVLPGVPVATPTTPATGAPGATTGAG